MVNKTKNKPKALKNTKNESGFFRALIFGFLICGISWLLLSVIFALIMSGQKDSNALGNVMSPAIVVISLFAGGFAAGKMDKSYSVITSFVLGTAMLGICYVLTSVLELSKGFGPAMKTVMILVMLVCPVIGAKIATRQKKRTVHRKRRM